MIEIKVPTVGESITEVQLLRWNKQSGEYVERDEVIAELESEKATFEVNAEKAGVLKTIAAEGDQLKIGDVLATIDETATASVVKLEITAPKPPAAASPYGRGLSFEEDQGDDTSLVGVWGQSPRPCFW